MTFLSFQSVIKNWSQLIAKNNISVESIIQFGSTCKDPIKKSTDVDLLYILNVQKKPTRFEAHNITKTWDQLLEKELLQFKDYNIIVNSHVKIPAQLDHLSPMYLDFPDCSKILFDRSGLALNLLDNISNWIARNKAQKIFKGQLWYWVYDDKDPNLPVDFRF